MDIWLVCKGITWENGAGLLNDTFKSFIDESDANDYERELLKINPMGRHYVMKRKITLKDSSNVIYKKTYHGFEDIYDIHRDISEAFDPRYNDAMDELGGHFQEEIDVLITYKKERK